MPKPEKSTKQKSIDRLLDIIYADFCTLFVLAEGKTDYKRLREQIFTKVKEDIK